MYTRLDGYSLFREDLEHMAGGIARSAAALRGARLLITGGTGFFGIWLLEGLLYANDKLGLDLTLCVLSRDPDRFLASTGSHLKGRTGIVWIKGTVQSFDDSAGPFTHILHAASESNPDGAKDWAFRHLNSALHGTQTLIDLAVKHKTKALLVTTSGAVYAHPDKVVDQRFVEGYAGADDYASEKNVYGQAKRTMETMVAVAGRHYGFRSVIARCFAFVGPYLALDSNYAIGNFMRDVMKGQPVVINGDGTPLRSYLYSADLVVWLVRLLAEGADGRAYNVGGEEAVSIGALAHLVNRCGGGKSEVVIRQQPTPGSVAHAYLPSTARARDELDLTAAIGLEEAVTRTMAWHRSRAAS